MQRTHADFSKDVVPPKDCTRIPPVLINRIPASKIEKQPTLMAIFRGTVPLCITTAALDMFASLLPSGVHNNLRPALGVGQGVHSWPNGDFCHHFRTCPQGHHGNRKCLRRERYAVDAGQDPTHRAVAAAYQHLHTFDQPCQQSC